MPEGDKTSILCVSVQYVRSVPSITESQLRHRLGLTSGFFEYQGNHLLSLFLDLSAGKGIFNASRLPFKDTTFITFTAVVTKLSLDGADVLASKKH